MTIIKINNVDVEFPKEPYQCQVKYMEKVLEALSFGTNALLESPTGTGKTLSLLCSSLAWQKMMKKNINKPQPEKTSKTSKSEESKESKEKVNVIIYAARTHTQLCQVVDELRDTSYRPKMSVLGSRDQLCIHEKISKYKGTMINHSCNRITQTGGCKYKNAIDRNVDLGNNVNLSVFDIEDLVQVGKEQKFCPYFYSREITEGAEIIFLPYNYLLDNSIRKTVKVDWNQSIIIFDEAHNLEKVASDAASFSLSTADIGSCVTELKQVLLMLKQDTELGVDVSELSSYEQPSISKVVAILDAIFELERRIEQIPLIRPPPTGSYQSAGPSLGCATLPGVHLINMLQQLKLLSDTPSELRKCANRLLDESNKNFFDVNLTGGATLQVSEPKIVMLATALERVARSAECHGDDYKVFIQETKPKTQGFRENNISKPSKPVKVLNFWCFSSGVVMKELLGLGVRSMIFTSGTLSPIEAIKEDLKISIPIVLQNPHVINKDQIWISAISTGPNGTTLNSSFVNRDNNMYKDDLGNSILTIYRKMSAVETTKIETLKNRNLFNSVKGGILVFFPSYTIMENTIERWKSTSLLESMRNAMGEVLIEQRGSEKKDFNSKKDDFNSKKIVTKSLDKDESEDQDDEYVESLVHKFDRAIERYGCCLLLAVCRGKVSEGIDFSNNKGRVVIVTGIPFAPVNDPWVMIKQQYLDEKLSKQKQPLPSQEPQKPLNSLSSNPWSKAQTKPSQELIPSNRTNQNNYGQPSSSYPPTYPPANPSTYPPHAPSSNPKVTNTIATLSGQQWYLQAASRAVNQCLGRVIRHKNDWGCIFLLDERFLQERQLSQLSTWMRPLVQKSSNYSNSMNTLEVFFNRIAMDEKLKIIKSQSNESSSIVQSASIKSKPKVDLRYETEIPFKRIREVLDIELGQEADQNFVNPDLLLTQNIAPSTTAALSSVPKSSFSFLPDHNSKFSESNDKKDLTSALDKLKSKGLERNPSIISKNSIQPSTKLTENTSIFGFVPTKSEVCIKAESSMKSFGLKSTIDLTQELPSKTENKTAQSDLPISKPLMLSQSNESFFTSTQPLPSTQSSTAAGFKSLISSQFSNKAKLTQTIQIKKEEYIERIKACLGKFKDLLSVNEIQEFKEFIKYWQQESGIKETSQISSFLNSLFKILSKIPTQLKIEIAEDLVVVVENRSLIPLYKNQIQKMLEQLKRPRSTVENIPLEEDIEKLGSERAKRLFKLTMTSKENEESKNKPFKLPFQRLEQAAALELVPSKASVNLATSGIQNTKLNCVICNEISKDPCAARCGHVCCQTCWVKWLPIKSICPACRRPATIDSITRIVIKK